jgi:enterochelin esterase family protein
VLKYGGIRSLIEKFDQISKTGKDDHALLNTLAMSACYSPNLEELPHLFDLPFDLKTGELRKSIWKKWKKFDPVQVVKTRGKNLTEFGLVYMDCGMRDEFGLFVGTRIFVKELRKQAIPHHHEEFEGGHFHIQDRYNSSLKMMAEYFST